MYAKRVTRHHKAVVAIQALKVRDVPREYMTKTQLKLPSFVALGSDIPASFKRVEVEEWS